ncbi:OTOF protein, partial [Oreotrochilus melanogaster]|nr:OTOF protein [Oreotrochilus melanogaster]
GKADFMGRTFAKPVVKMSDEHYCPPRFPPQLEYYQIYRGNSTAGDLLAAFELLQAQASLVGWLLGICRYLQGDPSHQGPYPLAVWVVIQAIQAVSFITQFSHGWRCLGSDGADHLQGSEGIPAPALPDVCSCALGNQHTCTSQDLPENELLHPPLNIRVVDCRAFGRYTLVGSHAVSSLRKFIYRPAERKAQHWNMTG